jgi:hypothetical protein
MKIDRAAFLLLAGTLAGAACNATEPPPPPAPPPALPPQTASVQATTPPPTPVASTPPVATTAPTHAADPADASAPVPAAVMDASVAQADASRPPVQPIANRKPLGGDAGCGVSRKTWDPNRPACDDNQGQLEDCVTLQGLWYPSNEVCPGPVMVRRRCSTYNGNYKPKVAAVAYACLKGAQGASCNSCRMFQCGHEALMSACPDNTADADCDAISAYCTEVDKNRCRSYLSGMTKKGRDAMVDCLKNACGKGFAQCAQNLPP